MSIQKMSRNITKSGILSDAEKEMLKSFWKEKGFITYICPIIEQRRYIYKYEENFYLDEKLLNPEELKLTSRVSIERIIITAIIFNSGYVEKFNGKMLIEQIKNGERFKSDSHLIIHIKDQDFFMIEDTQMSFKELELIFFLIKKYRMGLLEKMD